MDPQRCILTSEAPMKTEKYEAEEIKSPAPAEPETDEAMETARIQNRLKNLLWTISGDYSLGTEVDASLFRRSKYIALYDAVCKGSFARFFHPRTLEQYFEKAFLFGAEPSVLLPLSHVC